MLCDWLVTGHVLPVNPASAVGGPKHVVRRGSTPVLSVEDTRALIDAIDVRTIVELVASEHSTAEILKRYPYLEEEDIREALAYAAWRAEEIEVPLSHS